MYATPMQMQRHHNQAMTPAQLQSARAMAAQQANMQARQIVLDRAINMWQPIASATLSGTIPGQVVNIPLRNVGLIKRLLLQITCTFAQSAAETQNLTAWGPSNIVSQFVLTDLSNQTRINTTGWHMHGLASARRQMAFGAAFANDSPIRFGSNFPVITAPASITAAQPISMFYEIPLAYSDFDLRGAIYANVVNATMNLQFTVNPNFSVVSTADGTLAVYKSTTTALGTVSSFTYTLHQNYLDQIPNTDKGPILPIQDLSTAYLLNNTAVSGMNVNSDSPIPYANFRNFMSTMLIYDNGALNAGTDINYFSIQSANYTNIQKTNPFQQSLFAREAMSDDLPPGSYYFDHRVKPISTIQYGNMQLIVNPSNVAGATSQFLIGYEAVALINQITQAGSLYGV